MNASGLGLITILIIVLFAVVLGAQQLQDQQAGEIARLMQDRDNALLLAQEVTGQRDVALAQLEPTRQRVAALETEIAKKDAQLESLSGDLKAAQQQIAGLQKRYDEAVVQLNEGLSVPVTGRVDDEKFCLPDVASEEPFPWTVAAAGLVAGMVFLSGGGYLIYRIEANRRVTVHLTREQLRDYIRYQRSLTQ